MILSNTKKIIYNEIIFKKYLLTFSRQLAATRYNSL
jgi:hypothetical protein